MRRLSLALGLSGASISLVLAALILLGDDWLLFSVTSGLAGLPLLIRIFLGAAGAAAGFIGCALLNKHNTAAGVLMITGGVSSLISLFLGFIPFVLLTVAGIYAILPEKPAANPSQKANSPWITIIIDEIAIFLIGGLVFAFRDSLKSDLALISLSITISFFLGQMSALLILHFNKNKKQKSEQSLTTQPGDDSQKEKTS